MHKKFEFGWNARRSSGLGRRVSALLAITALLLGQKCFSAIGCTESAIQDLTRVIAIDPNFAAAYTERADCYMDQKNYERALFDLNRSLVLDPNSGDALYMRGRLMLLMNKPSLAIIDLRRGVAYEAMDKEDEAIRHYQASLRTPRLGTVGFIHRYADQPLDAKYRLSVLENGY